MFTDIIQKTGKPKSFYKYQSCKDVNSFRNLNSGLLFLSEPKAFSDSFDCILRLTTDYPDRFCITKEEFEKIVEEKKKTHSV